MVGLDRVGSTTPIAILDDYQGVALGMADWSLLEGRAHIVVFQDHISDATELVSRLSQFEVICVLRERTPLPRPILERLPKLKLIASVTMRNASIDMVAAKELGVTVCGTGSPSQGAPVLTWTLILAMLRNLPAELASVRNGRWQVSLGGDLKGHTLGVLGLGKIGSLVASVGRAFGMNVIAWSQNLTPEVANERGARLVSKEDLFRNSDILTLHMVLSDRSRGIVGARELALMKPSAYLINTSRGLLVDEQSLIEVLRRCKIAGAALDVYGVEPLPADHPFRSLGNVMATPHIGFVTRDTYKTFYRETVENIIAWLDGRPIRVLNP
jgi:phosphoglycerate dehydrogenase-like enzyme